ncbi:YqiA/YcfP family alpha/beta fold hydrolase [sulfur-oxidizing endosymbiont of Gigantopelta aegis]|uniref:YqiA/YcfP family alpha/beta fold hydrolase n=1 Tax=sulfur-oxidizing endosymbiont of Gigantopelta aegis TaxID=2794934 RepID=UPI0018DB1E18|nr:YqiA/YcfP family alpha/beta fold hydrolase [sulfur-oxidizing endosymbiont of Gigantopelta aegis]
MIFIYIHGFNSSPESYKAQCFSQFIHEQHPEHECISPQLSDQPAYAMSRLIELIENYIKQSKVAVLGSSLGGFYATQLAQQYDIKATLINPAVNPQSLLINYLGKNKNYHTGEEYEFTPAHIKQLDAISCDKLNQPDNLMVMLQTGDEVLDYRLAEKKYKQTHLMIEKGGDHSFQGFSRHCEAIYQFLQL